jgi:hypothetical protein
VTALEKELKAMKKEMGLIHIYAGIALRVWSGYWSWMPEMVGAPAVSRRYLFVDSYRKRFWHS